MEEGWESRLYENFIAYIKSSSLDLTDDTIQLIALAYLKKVRYGVSYNREIEELLTYIET